MEILVFGAGAVGGYLGARLSAAGNDVTLVVRGAATTAIQENGLSIIEDDHRTTTRPAIFSTLRQAVQYKSEYDQILICVKAYSAEAALNEIVAFYQSTPNIITLQNGIGVEEMFIKEFGADRVTAGSLTTPLSHESLHSIVVERSDRGLALAPTKRKQRIDQLVNLFQEAGIVTEGVPNYRSMKWSKALLNMVGNASSAILNRHPRVVYSYGPTFKLEREMLKETLVVMRKKKLETIDLPGVATGRLVFAIKRLPDSVLRPSLSRIVAAGRGNKLPSFHLDLAAGKKENEVSFHNGAVAEAGLDLGVVTPVNAALTDILLGIASKEIDYKIYDGQPKRLVAEVAKYQKAAKERK